MTVPKVINPVSDGGWTIPDFKVHVLHPTTQRGKSKARSCLWLLSSQKVVTKGRLQGATHYGLDSGLRVS